MKIDSPTSQSPTFTDYCKIKRMCRKPKYVQARNLVGLELSQSELNSFPISNRKLSFFGIIFLI